MREEDERKHDREYGDLAHLDTEIESQQRSRNFGPFERDLAKRAGEAEAVHETERERDAPAAPRVASEPIFDAHVRDRKGDQGLDDTGARRPNAEACESERDPMGQGERRERIDER